MNSTLYKTYVALKIQDPYKKYLFKCGIFYYFLDEDAKELHELLKVKLGQLNSTIVKCGFPVNSLEKYMNILKQYNYEIEIIDTSSNYIFNYENYKLNSKVNTLLKEISSLKVDSLSISQSYDILEDLKSKASELLKGFNK